MFGSGGWEDLWSGFVAIEVLLHLKMCTFGVMKIN